MSSADPPRHRATSLRRSRSSNSARASCGSCGTYRRVDLLEADTPEGLAAAPARTVLAGDDTAGVKDPVLHHDGHGWHLWASVHPLERWDDADRMTTEYATSPDGVHWTWRGTALAGRPG